MKGRSWSRVTPFLAMALALPLPARGSAPNPEGRFQNYQVCKGGPSKGADCTMDDQCPQSECVLDWVKGPGTSLPGTITVFYDDSVRDWRHSTQLGFQALSVVLEVKKGAQTHVFAEVYQAPDPTMQPEVLGWGGPPFDENDFASASLCNGMLYAQPDAIIAQALRNLAGLPAGKTPVVAKVLSKTHLWPHDGNDTLGSAVRCRVRIRFFNEP